MTMITLTYWTKDEPNGAGHPAVLTIEQAVKLSSSLHMRDDVVRVRQEWVRA